MGKHNVQTGKVAEALEARKKSAPTGQGYKLPGSQNRKKGYKARPPKK